MPSAEDCSLATGHLGGEMFEKLNITPEQFPFFPRLPSFKREIVPEMQFRLVKITQLVYKLCRSCDNFVMDVQCGMQE